MAVLRDDPYSGFNFQVEIVGVLEDGTSVRGAFREVSGLDVEVTPIEYRTGVDLAVRKLPGVTTFANIRLKRGIVGDLGLWKWMSSVLDGQPHRADGRITLLDEARQPVLSWKFRRGWPCKLLGPTLNATANEVAIETLEICHEGLEVE